MRNPCPITVTASRIIVVLVFIQTVSPERAAEMRPTPSHPSSAPSFWHWNSPLPYLFAGLGLMVVVITVALIILACSFWKGSARPAADPAGEKAAKPSAATAVTDDSPKIVVIMAGDDNPTHLAIPLPSSLSSSDCVSKV